jgi:glycerate 2-kinase
MAKHLIRNFDSLAVTPLRRDALAVLEAGFRAIDTRHAVERAVKLTRGVLRIGKNSWKLDDYEHAYVVGIGKAAYDAAVALERVLGARIDDGVILDVKAGPLKRMTSVAGTHPFPSAANVRATKKIMRLIDRATARDLVIVIVSGGGSALLCQPYKMKCSALALMTRVLMRRGATIRELNVVRKHLSEVQGGQLAKSAYPATVIGLCFSDVPGDDLGVIASGPTVRDTSTVDDAAEILVRYQILKACRMPECDLHETPKDKKFFRHVTNELVMCNGVALRAMCDEAKRRGYKARIFSARAEGEAREVGKKFARLPKAGEMVFGGGETTVTVAGQGRGGRNQEFALGAIDAVPDDGLVIGCASDGIDNTPAAGAVADATTRAVAAKKKLNAALALADNDAYAFFRAAGQHILTGVTGANVSDFMIAARRKSSRRN